MPTGRNEPCPCGSGRKFKNCCGKGGGTPREEPGPDLSLPSHVREFAREAGVWEADLVPVPATIAGKERERTVAALIKLRKGTFSLTKQGRSMLPPESAGRLYAHLFRSYFGKFNLDYGSRFSRTSGLQSAVPLLLWQMGIRAEKWISVAELADLILPPRPHGASERPGVGRGEDAFDLRHQVLKPLRGFGLLEEQPRPEAAGERYPGLDDILVRKTPLFDRFIRFAWD